MIRKSYKYLFFCSLFCSQFIGKAQELNLEVIINTPQLQLADPQVFNTLKTTIKEFYNTTVWTDDDFQDHEKIEGTIQINIKEDLSSSSFLADFYISTSRPVYHSNYYSQLVNLLDRDVRFSYEQYEPLYNNKTTFSDNLSAILSYYAYVVLGFDYDSFAPYGGERYFQIAQNIVTSVPSSVTAGDQSWVAVGSKKNRYWLVENVLNPRVRSFRSAFYEYHRLALDKMTDDPDMARANLLGSLQTMSKVNKTFPNSMIMKVFSDSKRLEILEIFKGANKGEMTKVYNIMAAIDPAQVSDFRQFKG